MQTKLSVIETQEGCFNTKLATSIVPDPSVLGIWYRPYGRIDIRIKVKVKKDLPDEALEVEAVGGSRTRAGLEINDQ